MDHARVFVKKPDPKVLVTCSVLIGIFVAVLWFAAHLNSAAPADVPDLTLKAAAGDTNAFAVLEGLGPASVSALAQLCTYRDGWRRLAWKVAPWLPRRTAKAFLTRVGPLRDESIRVAAAKILGGFGPKAELAIPGLLKALHDPQSYVAMEAAGALAKIGSAALPTLISALSEGNAVVRHAAAYALGEMGPRAEQAVPSLIGKLEDTDSEVRSSSASSLLLIGYPSIAAMSNVVDHGDVGSRQAAVLEFLRFYRSLRSMVPPLLKMAHAEEPEIRRSAITALGLMRSADHDSIQTFRNACHDPVLNVRLAAVSALGLVPNSAAEAVAELTDCINDPSVELAVSAARLLGTIGPAARSALPRLKQCYSASQDPLRATVQSAVEKITCDSSQTLRSVPPNF